ncbi:MULTISPECIES: DUF6457 domain-containing protein [unclassified Frondihabitans]|uniref:DUF6457 domain-containing protein n=1 Tax=unclassified Frondihabitans TaxID=2626248 RepID=UPI000FBFD230|nr:MULTISPECIES: DUF6457 domain-containing protein [unclassified Frondihabitans]RPE78744.1 hypothetical protein EDF37_1425 [Frondihabitans sp. PhB153]RPF09025.1 hypothetical protein EDF39_1427 [Frondihabitans sp. PhB161]
MTDHDVLTTWVARLSEALQLPADFELDLDEVLDLARDAAHGVARPAAPVTTFLVGYAAGLQGGGAADVTTAVGVATRLATDDAGTASR